MDTTKSAPAQAELVLHGEVVGVNAVRNFDAPPQYRVEISVGAGTKATLYVTLPEAPPLRSPFDIILRSVES